MGGTSTLATRLSPTASAARRDGLAWLIRLRWAALGAVLAGAFLGPRLFALEVHLPVLLTAVGAGAAYNAALFWSVRRHPECAGTPLLHAMLDFGALTLVLWASGGVLNPFVSLYFVHVLLVSLLVGPRSSIAASAAALGCAGLLVLADSFDPLRVVRFQVHPERSTYLGGLAFVVTIGASAYIARRAAAEVARGRAEAEAARRTASRDSEILLSALDRLEVGVEVVGPDRAPRFQNRHLLRANHDPHACWRTSVECEPTGGRCPVDEAREGRFGACRFSQRAERGRERVIELLSFPLSDERPSPVLRLHIDRTESFLAERRLHFSERLSSLGRTVQTVAHELNTPLSTIQTLATDMRSALSGLPPEAAPVARDLDESLALSLDELRRCRAITQHLLGRGADLDRPAPRGECDVEAAARRAAALVFATSSSPLRIDPALAGLTAAIDCDALVQVFVNLLQNAADAIEGRPEGRIWVNRGPRAAGRVEIEVEDNGVGIAPGSRERLFEAFFTTKPQGKGTGLGLFTTSSLVQEAGGTVTLEDRPSGGARARVALRMGGVRG